MLALHSGSTMRAAHLADVLGVQLGALRATVSRVRRLIGDDVLISDPIGYRLDATTDTAAFVDLVARGVAGEGIDCFDRALALWHGPAIDEFATDEWAAASVVHMEELRRVAIEGRGAALISAGRVGEATAALEMHLADHPLRDRAHGLLMLALASDGRQAEALRVYQRYRHHLAEQIGTVPSADVTALERWIAEPTTTPLDPMWPTRAPSLETASGTMRARRLPDNVPTFRSSFVGRRVETDTILLALRNGRTVTVVGEGGVGKTRLAATVAAQLVETGLQVWFIELASMNDGADLVGTVAAQVGAPVLNALDGLQGFIGNSHSVLVLDNAEHLLDDVADLVDILLASCPALLVLTTSRVPLGIEGERVVRLSPLDPQIDAPELFLARAESAGAALRPDQRDDVESLCSRLDGNPLAIELAATRVAALGLRAVIDGLDDRFTLLSGGRGRDGRHRTLRAVVEWSDRLLSPHERAVFRILGVFSGGFEIDAAQHVVHGGGLSDVSVLPTLVALVERSMVVAEPAVAGTRFRLLDTLRAYALEQLTLEGELAVATAAQAAWVASITDAPLDEWMTRDGHRRSLRLEREVDNWRCAVNHAAATNDAALASRLCGVPTGLFLWGRPDLLEHVETLDRLMLAGDAAAVGVGRAGPAYARWGSAWVMLDLIALDAACDHFDLCVPDDTSGIAATMRSAAVLAGGDVRAATAIRSEAICDPRTNPGGRDLTTAMAVYGACRFGARELVADSWIERARELARSSDVPTIRKIARVAMCWVLGDVDPETSATLLHETMADPEPIPMFWDRLTDLFVSRFLTVSAPPDAARHLLRVLPRFDAGFDSADAMTLVTSAALLAENGHRWADDIVASLAAAMSSQYMATMVPDIVERCARGRVLAGERLISLVRTALEEVGGVTANADHAADASV